MKKASQRALTLGEDEKNGFVKQDISCPVYVSRVLKHM